MLFSTSKLPVLAALLPVSDTPSKEPVKPVAAEEILNALPEVKVSNCISVEYAP